MPQDATVGTAASAVLASGAGLLDVLICRGSRTVVLRDADSKAEGVGVEARLHQDVGNRQAVSVVGMVRAAGLQQLDAAPSQLPLGRFRNLAGCLAHGDDDLKVGV